MLPRFQLKFAVAAGFILLLITCWAEESRHWHIVSGAAAVQAPAANPQQIIFNRDIRPILADRCFSCHGPDPNKRQAGLRLDRPEGATGPLPGHPNLRAFVAGKPDQSEALLRILSKDPAIQMPPPTSHLKLDEHEKEVIREWIEQGGQYQEHWAFVAPVRPPRPAVQDAAWPRNDIDYFVLARLESEGLHPSPQADKETLIRRVSLDLTGIPPTVAEVDAYLADQSPNAYEKVVDRLLASPRYGEQMAIQWLDCARYADSHGYQSDPQRFMWHWRDWVINAFNANMPYDEFTIEQIAGDLLPNATDEQRLATGFNRNHRINSEGGAIDEEWRVESVIDRVETTSNTFLGLTMGCCRCHDHKFDPITQKEFYSFSAYFNSLDERGLAEVDRGVNAAPMMHYYSAAQKQRLAELTTTLAASDEVMKSLQPRLPALEKQLRDNGGALPQPSGLLTRLPLDGSLDGTGTDGKPLSATVEGAGNPKFVDGPDGKSALKCDPKGVAVRSTAPLHLERTDAFTFGAWVKRHAKSGSIFNNFEDAPAVRGFELAVDGEKAQASFASDAALRNLLRVDTKAKLPADKWVHVMVTYDGSGNASGVRIFFDGQLQQTVPLVDDLSDTILSQAPLLIGRRTKGGDFDGAIADVRVYDKALTPAQVFNLAFEFRIHRLLMTDDAKLTPQDRTALTTIVLEQIPEYAAAHAEHESAQFASEALADDPSTTSMVMEDLPKPRPTYVLIRGQYDKHGAVVQPGVPAVLPPLPKDAPPNRLGLAKWIVDPANPLTARVEANRLWEKFFGVGIEKTSENFGTQSEWPSHPELLDWLATELVKQHWDMKAFQKEIVMSATYQQSSNVTPDLLDRDPENRLLARGPRFRLGAETVRDQALAVSGLLVEQIGGRSVYPYAPLNLWADNQYGNLKQYIEDTGENLYRRSLYTFIKRTAPPPDLAVFDMPSREFCQIRRSRTDTPLQALDLLNNETYVEAARVLAEHVIQEGGSTPQDRIDYAFRRVLCRRPNSQESLILQEELGNELGRYKKDPDAAKKLIAVGAQPVDAKLDPCELAAYTMTASTILNLDETVTKP